jgi:hypothetical protein
MHWQRTLGSSVLMDTSQRTRRQRKRTSHSFTFPPIRLPGFDEMAMPLRDLAPATSPPRAIPSSTLSARRRQKSYQACEHCRRRKAKCEVEEIHGTTASSCIRCRRERKRCVFSAERSSKPSKNQLLDSHGIEKAGMIHGSDACDFRQPALHIQMSSHHIHR